MRAGALTAPQEGSDAMRQTDPVTVARIDFYDYESCQTLKHAIWSSRDREWLRGVAVMLFRDVAVARNYDQESQVMRRSITSSTDDEWLRSTAEYLLRRNRDLETERRIAAAVRTTPPAASPAPTVAPYSGPPPLQRVVVKVVERDPATGLISKVRETTVL
jgi:hypothetical protein